MISPSDENSGNQINILNKKYNVVIDSINPDIVIYTNQFYRENELDYETIFTCNYYTNYLAVLREHSHNNVSRANLKMDLDRANLYISKIVSTSPQQGGRKKKTQKVKKYRVKAKKSSRKSLRKRSNK